MQTRMIIWACALVITGCAQAQPVIRQQVEVPVVDVEPIEVTEQIPVDREVCWEEREIRHRHHGSASATIAGAILGGVIGNQFGGGSGKKALTVAGAALGASIANDASRRHHAYPARYERCEVQRDYETRTYVSGYRVFYEYEGEIYETRMRYRPGRTIRLQLTAVPLD
ncbi:MAG: hypothetical protein Kow0020_13180 [Wenzhouxiangellaceae bacterium]